ncbi:unnamed protein product [Brugia pahangi]|uniref:Uncharacterized protein n=1 Tax=Brugia pahangi TaxID=6280 RepID=A0A3P7QWW8_BRUPA|nr:unnamed protein product [Brugia pahangi]
MFYSFIYLFIFYFCFRFFTSPDKVNGLKGFNFTWTEVKKTTDSNECLHPTMYLCTYTKLCIDARLKCNGDKNCGLHDDTDEAYCMLIYLFILI